MTTKTKARARQPESMPPPCRTRPGAQASRRKDAMMPKRLLIANRGEVAVRIARAAADLAIHTVAIYSEDDANSGHLRFADAVSPLNGRGPSAYLDAAQILTLARDHDCDA